MKVLAQLSFNSIIFIESLDDPTTTKDIFTHIDYHGSDWIIGKFYHHVKNGDELIEVLNAAINNPEIFPLLHFATHGNESGIVLTQGSLKWDVIAPLIQKLNLKLRNELVVIMASCFGARLLGEKGFDFERSPFGLLIGPIEKINWYSLDEDLLNFYLDAIKYGVDQALTNMNDKYHHESFPYMVFTSNGIFASVFRSIFNDINYKDARHYIMNKYRENHGEKMPYDMKYELDEAGIINVYRENFKAVAHKYFLIDIYPELQERFSVRSFDEYMNYLNE